MANLQLYSKATITINGLLLTEEGSVTVQRLTGAQEVDTVAKGFAGVSPGAPRLKITLENAVPAADFELNPGPYMKLLEEVEVSVFAGGRTLTTKGFVMEDNFSHATSTPSKLTMNITAQWADWI